MLWNKKKSTHEQCIENILRRGYYAVYTYWNKFLLCLVLYVRSTMLFTCRAFNIMCALVALFILIAVMYGWLLMYMGFLIISVCMYVCEVYLYTLCRRLYAPYVLYLSTLCSRKHVDVTDIRIISWCALVDFSVISNFVSILLNIHRTFYAFTFNLYAGWVTFYVAASLSYISYTKKVVKCIVKVFYRTGMEIALLLPSYKCFIYLPTYIDIHSWYFKIILFIWILVKGIVCIIAA